MEIRIGGYVASSFLLEQEPDQWHTLVVLDSDKHATDFVKAHARSYCYLRFDDIEEQRANKVMPTKAVIEQGLNFAKGKDKLLVSCRAGQGRSVALAYVIFCQEHGLQDAVKLLNLLPRTVTTDEGDAVSEWATTVAAIRQFLDTEPGAAGV